MSNSFLLETKEMKKIKNKYLLCKYEYNVSKYKFIYVKLYIKMQLFTKV